MQTVVDPEILIFREWMEQRGYKYASSHTEGELWIDQDTKEEYFLFLSIADTIQVKLVDQIVKMMNLHHITNAIKIFRYSTSSCVKNKMEELKIKIELVCADQLKCNILKHKYQPKMTKCNTYQARNANALHKCAMPQISKDDPVVILMNWKRGDIIAICPDKCQELKKRGKCCEKTRFRIVI